MGSEPMTTVTTLDKTTHTYSVGNEPIQLCVSDVLLLAGILEPYPDIPRVQQLVKHAGELGSTVHEWAEYLDDEHEPDTDSLAGTEVLPYILAYQRFRECHQPHWDYVESSFHRDGCAGTPDRIGTIKTLEGDQTPAIVDIKTAVKRADYWQLQLTAYSWMAPPMPPNLYVLHLRSDATWRLIPQERDVPTWEAALTVAKWLIASGRKIKER